ncbi:hypothetical protein MNBD_ACTINO01-1662 [hydrothermal vent metagenome]|uniref:Uncharacterized protein n=1 Tax=hydrothermal vent metagenome TaxID=652676 RepID=A0A3B0SVL9_9ZZZZ
MPSPIDDLFAQISDLSTRIAALDESDPTRKKLERNRVRLRDQAASIADAGRHPESVRLEIESIQNRLAQINGMKITEGYQEKRGGKIIQDPGAYSATINRLLSEHHAEEIEQLTDRLARLRSLLDDSGA